MTFFFQLQKEYSEQWALACGEILRVLTHYNRPIFKVESQHNEAECSSTSDQATSNGFKDKKSDDSPGNESDRKPLRPLTPWITDILLAAPLGIRSDYFRWWVIIFEFDIFCLLNFLIKRNPDYVVIFIRSISALCNQGNEHTRIKCDTYLKKMITVIYTDTWEI